LFQHTEVPGSQGSLGLMFWH